MAAVLLVTTVVDAFEDKPVERSSLSASTHWTPSVVGKITILVGCGFVSAIAQDVLRPKTGCSLFSGDAIGDERPIGDAIGDCATDSLPTEVVVPLQGVTGFDGTVRLRFNNGRLGDTATAECLGDSVLVVCRNNVGDCMAGLASLNV